MVVFNLYSKLTSISDISSNNTKVIHVANLINRSPDQVSLRLANYVACDPAMTKLGYLGMNGGGSNCQKFFDEFMAQKDSIIAKSDLMIKKLEKGG